MKITAEIARNYNQEYNINKQKELQAKADEAIEALEAKIIASAKQGFTGYYFTTSPDLMPLISKAFREAGFQVTNSTESAGTVDWSGVEA